MENPWRGQSKVNPQVEGKGAHFRRINTEILRAMIGADLSGGEWAITMAVIDSTWGMGVKCGALSLTNMQQATGLTRPGVVKIVKKLEARRILLVNRGLLPTQYAVNKHFDTWLVNSSLLPQLVNPGLPKVVNSSLLPGESLPIIRNKKQKTPYISPPLGEFSNVFLTQVQLEKLEVRFLSESKAKDKIENLSAYIEQIGKKKSRAKYKSHYATILNWERMDEKRRPQAARPTDKPTCSGRGCGNHVNRSGDLCSLCEEVSA